MSTKKYHWDETIVASVGPSYSTIITNAVILDYTCTTDGFVVGMPCANVSDSIVQIFTFINKDNTDTGDSNPKTGYTAVYGMPTIDRRLYYTMPLSKGDNIKVKVVGGANVGIHGDYWFNFVPYY